MSDYQQLFELRAIHAGRMWRQLREERGWKPEELASIPGISRQMIYYILTGKSNITPETATRLAAAFGNTAEEWIRWDALFKLASTHTDTSAIGLMSRLYAVAPIRDIQRRGWIKTTAAPSVLA